MPKSSKLGKINFSSLSLPESQLMSQLIDNVNTLGGHNGEVELSNHLNLGGNNIKNVAAPTSDSDALTSGAAKTSYSAAALKPQLQANSGNSLDTYRMINSNSQREQQSSWLNDLMSTPPNANNIIPLTTNSISGGVITSSSLGAGGTSGYSNASNLPTTTSGSGTGALAAITAAGGVVTGGSVFGGLNYAIGDKVYPTQSGSVGSAYFLVAAITNAGSVTVTIPASPFTFADGSKTYLYGRTDTLSLPTSYGIHSISSVGNLVTVVTYVATGLTAQSSMTIAGVSPAGFNGSYPISSATPPYTFTYQASLGTVSGSGGSVEVGNVWYYSVKKGSRIVILSGPYSGDTAQNRLQVNFDGNQIVAVVVLTNSGGQVSLSGGGGSPIVGSPTAGVFF